MPENTPCQDACSPPDQQRGRGWLVPLGVFLFPCLVLLPHQLCVAGRYVAIGNDFLCLYYSYKAYLVDYLRHLDWPLWSPSEAAGYPFFSNPDRKSVV